MSKKLQLSIPQPCHEDWNNMTPVEKGKFCGSCRKQVVDFSQMSDREIAQFFKKPILSLAKDGSVCGRFMTDQLDRSIEIPRKRIPWLKYFFSIALPAFFFSKASAQKMGAMPRPGNTDTIRVPMSNEFRTLGMVMPTCIEPVNDSLPGIKMRGETGNGTAAGKEDTSRIGELITLTSSIKGKVLDENGALLSLATVMIRGTQNGVMTNEKGEFNIKPGSNNREIILVASSVGYLTKEITIDRNSDPLSIVLQKVPREFLTGVIITCRKPFVKKQVKEVPLIPAVTHDEANTAFKVFPNPVTPGSSLNIELKQTEEGYFAFQLLSLGGQQVNQQEIWIDAEARILNIDIPTVAAGSYFLVLTNKKTGKKASEKIIIQ